MYGIYANIWGILMVNVTIYSILMDPMGYVITLSRDLRRFRNLRRFSVSFFFVAKVTGGPSEVVLWVFVGDPAAENPPGMMRVCSYKAGFFDVAMMNDSTLQASDHWYIGYFFHITSFLKVYNTRKSLFCPHQKKDSLSPVITLRIRSDSAGFFAGHELHFCLWRFRGNSPPHDSFKHQFPPGYD